MIQFVNDHEVLLSARVSIDDVRDLLHLEIPDSDADSIGGLVYEQLGEIPKPGASIVVADARITVDTVRRQSIRSVRVTCPRSFKAEREGEDQEASAAEAPREAHQ